MSWIAAILELIGVLLLRYKKSTGWLVFVAGSLLWTYVGLTSPGAHGLILVCPILILLNCSNYLKWRKDEKN